MIETWSRGHTVPEKDVCKEDIMLTMDAHLDGPSIFPDVLGIWAECHAVPQEREVTIERIHDGVCGGKTSLYQKGHVALDAGVSLKPHSRFREIVVRYAGPTEGALHAALKQGDVVYRKIFPVWEHALRLSTQTHRQDRDVRVNAEGFPSGVWPLYPYGGFVPPRGGIDQADMVFFVPGWAPQTQATVLRLYRQIHLEQQGFFAPDPFVMEGRTWLYQPTDEASTFHTLGGDIVNGCIRLLIGGEVYLSRSYQLWGGSDHRMKIFLEKQAVL